MENDEKFYISDNFPPGYRFKPSDDILIEDYLSKKIKHQRLPPNKIHNVNLYSYHPNDLTGNFELNDKEEREWFFFTSRNKKYPNGSRPNRTLAGGQGYWKPTGTDKRIHNERGEIIGYRKSLDFYDGKHPTGQKSKWKMHEFRIHDNPTHSRITRRGDMQLDECVLCKIYEKTNAMKENFDVDDDIDRTESSSSYKSSDHEADFASNTQDVIDSSYKSPDQEADFASKKQDVIDPNHQVLQSNTFEHDSTTGYGQSQSQAQTQHEFNHDPSVTKYETVSQAPIQRYGQSQSQTSIQHEFNHDPSVTKYETVGIDTHEVNHNLEQINQPCSNTMPLDYVLNLGFMETSIQSYDTDYIFNAIPTEKNSVVEPIESISMQPYDTDYVASNTTRTQNSASTSMQPYDTAGRNTYGEEEDADLAEYIKFEVENGSNSLDDIMGGFGKDN